MTLDELLNLDELARLIAERYVAVKHHPKLTLDILNYTPKTQFERHWTPETELCRGLIVDRATRRVVARPFRKFFNLGERAGQVVPDEPFVAYEKLDGSLAISYLDGDGLPALATRGSFLSDQAQRATAILRTRYATRLRDLADACTTLTFCFEVILPENRIVVDYGDREDLVLLAVFETATGRELADDEVRALGYPFARPACWDYPSLASAADDVEGPGFDNQEGLVVRFASGLRLKLKRSEYVRLHRLVTGLTPRRIWQMLKDGSPPIGRLFAGTPAGFQDWARARIGELEDEYRRIEREARGEYARIVGADDPGDRKRFALQAAGHPHAPVLFKLYDGKPYDAVIWKRLKPGPADPFRVEV